jgi:hypothetical protein
MFEPGMAVEVALVDRPELDFDTSGVVKTVSPTQGILTVKLTSPEDVAGRVEMLPFGRVRPA